MPDFPVNIGNITARVFTTDWFMSYDPPGAFDGSFGHWSLWHSVRQDGDAMKITFDKPEVR